MNIKNRLEKLKGEMLRDVNSEVCKCPGENRYNVLIPNLDKSDADRERERAEWLEPIDCNKCRKTIERKLIEVVYVDGDF